MSLAERAGAKELRSAAGRVRVLPAAPLIAPALQFVFPMAVPGEEDALNRGSHFLEVTPAAGQTFLAQCALGFTGAGVANGLWPSFDTNEVLAVCGGYAYALNLLSPTATTLLPMRPVVDIVVGHRQLVLLGYQHALVQETGGKIWQSDRISWEGIGVTALEGDLLRGMGWNMPNDAEVPFTLDLNRRSLTGGGFHQP